jgi:predicted acylesterase/phospholipase RssA
MFNYFIDESSSFVCAVSQKMGRPFRFRSYDSDWDYTFDCPIWQTCRATSAAPTLFPPMVIGNPPTAYVDGGLGYNNPILPLMDEARHIWPNRDIGCIVSVGSGMLESKDIGSSLIPLFGSLKAIATDSEKVADEFQEDVRAKHGVNQRVYFRLNVQHGLEQVGLEEWKETERIFVAIQNYTTREWVQIDACASQLHRPTGM